MKDPNKSQQTTRCSVVVRHRGWIAVAILVTAVAGLTSRKFPWLLPEAFGKYPGDALWAQVAYWCVAFLFPSAPIARVAACALAISYADELSQLYQAPWINEIRATTIGHLVLGSAFSWGDIVAYTIGVGLCSAFEVIHQRTTRIPARPNP